MAKVTALGMAFALAAAAVGQEAPERPAPVKAGQLVRFEVLIADLKEAVEAPTAAKILEMDKAGTLQARVRFQLSAVENVPAMIQFSEIVPRVIGYAGRPGRGGPASMPVHRDTSVGTNLRVTARVGDDQTIATQFFLERTSLAGDIEKPPEPNAAGAPPPIDRMQINSTLKLKVGETQVIAAQGTGAGRTWVVVTGRLGTELETPK